MTAMNLANTKGRGSAERRDVRSVIVFDVNETLLDLTALDPHFERVFGDSGVRALWFQQMLFSAFVGIASNRYVAFGAAARGALKVVAARRGLELSNEDETAIVRGMTSLPPHPEVTHGLERLRAAGFRLATLTNSRPEVAEAQIENAGLSPFFELLLSADAVGRLKPAPEPYRMSAEQMGVALGDVWLVAAHAWDITGAIRAGCRGAFVSRPGAVLDPTGETPNLQGADLEEVAAAIIAADG